MMLTARGLVTFGKYSLRARALSSFTGSETFRQASKPSWRATLIDGLVNRRGDDADLLPNPAASVPMARESMTATLIAVRFRFWIG